MAENQSGAKPVESFEAGLDELEKAVRERVFHGHRVQNNKEPSRAVGRAVLIASRPSGRLDPLESGSAA